MGVSQFPKQKHDGAELFQLKLNDMLLTQRKSGWIEIMDFIYEELPFLKNHCRPKTEDINNSFIGILGYATWRDYLEKGLHWSEDKWKVWHTAYSRVESHPYLRNCDVSRNAINEAYKELKENFPNDVLAWNQYQERKKLRKAGPGKPMHEDDEPDYLIAQLGNLEHEYHLERRENIKLKTRCLEINNKLNEEQLKAIENETYIACVETENTGFKGENIELTKSNQEKQKIITKLTLSVEKKEKEINRIREALSAKESKYKDIEHVLVGHRRTMYRIVSVNFVILSVLAIALFLLLRMLYF